MSIDGKEHRQRHPSPTCGSSAATWRWISSTPAQAPGTARPTPSGCPVTRTSRPGAARWRWPPQRRTQAKPHHARPRSAAFARVQACRDDMYEIFPRAGRRLSTTRSSPAAPAPCLRRSTRAGSAHPGGTEGCAWTWDPGSDLLAPLWPIVAAAVELLTHGTTGHIKSCRACRFLFIDHSKNGSRRWCSMDDCGKAAKIARYLQRRSDARGQEKSRRPRTTRDRLTVGRHIDAGNLSQGPEDEHHVRDDVHGEPARQ